MTEPAVHPAPRKRRRWWLLLLLLPALLIVFWVYFSFSAQQRLARALAETDRLDPHWRFDDLQAERPVVPDEENAALVMIAAFRKMPPDWNPDMPNVKAKQVISPRLKPNEALTEQQTAAVRGWLEPCAEALPEARRLADLPRARWPDGETLFDALGTARLLSWDAFLRAEEGDLDGALASCRAAVNGGRAAGEQPSIMPQLVRLAVDIITLERIERTLGQGEPSEAALAMLQQMLSEEGQAPQFTIALRGERAFKDHLLESAQRGELTAQQMKTQVGSPALLYLPGVIAGNRAATLEQMNKMVEISKLPPEQQGAAMAPLQASVQNEPLLLRRIMGRDVSPVVLARYMDDARRHQAQIRCAAVGLALERYRRKHGRWPEALDDLKDEFLPEFPSDPFNGQPLRYDKSDEGVTVCSAGPDGKYDVCFRLWNVDKRRQPPPSPAPESRP
jgi:hypothetical protein